MRVSLLRLTVILISTLLVGVMVIANELRFRELSRSVKKIENTKTETVVWKHVKTVKYVNLRWNTPKVQSAIKGLAEIQTRAKYKYKTDDSEVMEYEQTAIAIPLHDNYILALSHATFVDSVPVPTPFGTFNVPVDFVEQPSYWIKNKVWDEQGVDSYDQIELVGRFEDISLFRSVEEDIKAFPFMFGDSDTLLPGKPVLSVGFSFTELINLKDGIVSNVDVGDAYGGDVEDTFLFSASVNPGDSGSPVLGYDDNQLVIYGITQSLIQDGGLAFALKSNYVLNAIEKIKRVAELKKDLEKVTIE